MRAESTSQTDSTSGMIPPVSPRSPWRVAEVTAYPDFRLKVRFLDGLQGWVEMKELIQSKNAGVFSILADPGVFEKVYIEYGVVTWPGGIDLAPDAMYDAIKAAGIWHLA